MKASNRRPEMNLPIQPDFKFEGTWVFATLTLDLAPTFFRRSFASRIFPLVRADSQNTHPAYCKGILLSGPSG
jgi:hypothetical protein